MELGNTIKRLRYKASMTQEQLAEQLGVTAQSVSKWENAAAMPDIMLLPAIATAFGVSIDELFSLTDEQRLLRIENRMDTEAELPGELFYEYEEYLKTQLTEKKDKGRIISLLAHLYHHRMLSDSAKVSCYARESIRLAPEKKDCQWLLDKAENAVTWDWNVGNHAKVIDFYKEVIANDLGEPKTPLPYYYLIDNLIADHRTAEAKQYLEMAAKLPAWRPQLNFAYKAHIALAEFDADKADAIMEEGEAAYPNDGILLFEKAQYHALKCEYDKAIEYYEKSFASDKQPRFIDALQGIAIIHEIQGDYTEAATIYDRIIECQKAEWGLTEETELKESEAERQRLLDKAAKASQ